MVRYALAELGDVSANALCAFVEQKHGVRIEPRFIPVYKASIRYQEGRAATRLQVRGADPPHTAAVPSVTTTSPLGFEVCQLAQQLMAVHGLNGWRFRFNRCKTALGLCVHHRRTIELSIYLVERTNPLDEIRDTILHEIAHALVGPRHGHDAVWRRKCRQIGARPMRCGHANMPEGCWQARCSSCGASFDRHRKPKRTHGWFCKRCGAERGRLVWVKNRRPVEVA
jgi:predicted SprT family Zn-dependent metalloprotease